VQQKGYKAQFFDDLLKNLRLLEGKLTGSEENTVTKSVKNSCLFAKALHDTFKDAGDIAGMMLMAAGCDYSPIDKK
jgi:hypothetical protein